MKMKHVIIVFYKCPVKNLSIPVYPQFLHPEIQSTMDQKYSGKKKNSRKLKKTKVEFTVCQQLFICIVFILYF